MDDLISRQAAIDTAKRLHDVAWTNCKETKISANTMIDALKNLPSAPSEIIRCKDCKYYTSVMAHCEIRGKGLYLVRGMDDFCSRAERRTDGTSNSSLQR